MKPGRELDALIAEKVMGLGWCQLMPEGYATRETGPKRCGCGAIGYPYEHHAPYSTDIAAAWLAVEKLGLFKDMVLSQSEEGMWQIHHRHDEHLNNTTGSTAPLAICLAALKALDIELENTETNPKEKL